MKEKKLLAMMEEINADFEADPDLERLTDKLRKAEEPMKKVGPFTVITPEYRQAAVIYNQLRSYSLDPFSLHRMG